MKTKESHQEKTAPGDFKDVAKVRSLYQQTFVEKTNQLCPYIFEDLRKLLPFFKDLLANNEEGFLPFFEEVKMKLFDLDELLFNQINLVVSPPFRFNLTKYNQLQSDFVFGEYLFLFNILSFLYVSPEKKLEESIVREIEKGLFIKADDRSKIETNNLISESSKECKRIFQEIVGNNENSFASCAKQLLVEILSEISPTSDFPLQSFINLHKELINWAIKNHLRKDWLLVYAFDFLKQLNQNPSLEISDLEIGLLDRRSLITLPFTFNFRGWFPGDESKTVYQKEITKNFNDQLAKYFEKISLYLDLSNKTRITKPLDLDRLEWLVRWTVQDWTMTKIFAKYDKSKRKDTLLNLERFERKVFKAFETFAENDLPVRAKKYPEKILP